MRRRTVQTIIYQFQGKRITEIPRITNELLNEGKTILLLIARRED